MGWRTLLCMTLWLACLAPASQAGIIFNRKKAPANQADQVAGLLQTLHSDSDEHHRAAAAEALAKIDPNSNPGIIPALEEAAQSDVSNQVRDAARATLSHYFSNVKSGQSGSKTLQTSEPPLAVPSRPATTPSTTPASRSTPTQNPAPRVGNRSNVRESAEPPLATGVPPQTPAPPPSRPAPPVVVRTPAPQVPVVNDSKPMIIQTGPAAPTPPAPAAPATTVPMPATPIATTPVPTTPTITKPVPAPPAATTPMPSTPATTFTPRLANPAAQTVPTVRPPVMPTQSTFDAAQTAPAAPAAKPKTPPGNPQEDGPVLNPPG